VQWGESLFYGGGGKGIFANGGTLDPEWSRGKTHKVVTFRKENNHFKKADFIERAQSWHEEKKSKEEKKWDIK